MEGTSTAISIPEASGTNTEAKALVPPPAQTSAPVVTKRESRFGSIFRKTRAAGGWKRGLACIDFILRLFAITATIIAAIMMGTTDETLPFFTHYYQFEAKYDDFPALTFFVIGNAIAGGYLVLSLVFALISLVRPHAVGPRLLLLIFDTVVLGLTTAAAAAAAAIVSVAHDGNQRANWVAICLRFDGFCQRISGAIVASFVAVLILMLLILMSGLAMRKH
ncbi:casparian strip membrane protein 1-like [Dioscorea cayenensis subsp. rotundata]|uniref:CASP-like protein n=1 Tax=Dioscorea cayennensis subsp. rotundata TaxID=55577 RepID=A0AB40B8E5_DIOCR|nr:casparian strip membrane protein 1-like [Dioscorea cayenensis subsp. rotundata]